jgi:hypothetical protein
MKLKGDIKVEFIKFELDYKVLLKVFKKLVQMLVIFVRKV